MSGPEKCKSGFFFRLLEAKDVCWGTWSKSDIKHPQNRGLYKKGRNVLVANEMGQRGFVDHSDTHTMMSPLSFDGQSHRGTQQPAGGRVHLCFFSATRSGVLLPWCMLMVGAAHIWGGDPLGGGVTIHEPVSHFL